MNVLLQTKLIIPPIRREIVSRSHLWRQLDAGSSHRLTLVSAPAGFGKTTLLAEWARQVPMPVSWLSLDESDNAPARFLSYLVAAIQTVDPAVGQSILPVLQISPLPAVETLLIPLLNDLTAIAQPLVVVLDDYQMITSQPIHDMLIFLLDQFPPTMRLILSTRTDPPLPIPRLRASGQLTEIRSGDLGFSDEETAILLNSLLELDIPEPQVSLLRAHTEGWIAGMQLAALALKNATDRAAFITTFAGSHQYIADYLADEVLRRQSPDVKSFLLQTSILNSLSGLLCEAVTGQSRGQEVLETLHGANLFLVPLDTERRWYRYHRLFADLLRQRMRYAFPDEIAPLHRRASAWYAENGFIGEAIDHALAAADFSRAVYLLELHTGQLMTQPIAVLHWLDQIPDELVTRSPALCIARASILSTEGHLDTACRWLDAAADHLVAEPPDDPLLARRYRGMIASIRSYIAHFQGDIPGTIEFSRQALDYLPDDNLTWRSGVALDLGDAYSLNGDLNAAGEVFRETLAAARSSNNVYLILTAIIKLAGNQRYLGQLHDAWQLGEEGLQIAESGGFGQTGLTSGLYVVLAEVSLEWNDLDAALHYATRAVALSEPSSFVVLKALSSLVLATVYVARQDWANADTLIHQLEHLESQRVLPSWMMSRIGALRSRIWTRTHTLDSLKSAEAFLRQRGVLVVVAPVWARLDEYFALAYLLLAQSSLVDVHQLLDRLGNVVQTAGMVGKQIEVRILRALAFQADQDTSRALDTLSKALRLAEPERFIRVFVDADLPLARLLYRAAEQDIYPDYVGQLLAAFPPLNTAAKAPHGEGKPILVETLSEREIEVLYLIAEGLSNQDIAQRLFVSLRTVKWHTGNIYSKLGVKNRTQALHKASELGILKTP